MTKATVLTAAEQAAKLPPPKPGLRLKPMPIEVLCEYMNMHGLEVVRGATGGVVMVRKARAEAGSMREVAESLAKVG